LRFKFENWNSCGELAAFEFRTLGLHKELRKKHNLSVAPAGTRIFVAETNETDFTTPLLQKHAYTFSRFRNLYWEKSRISGVPCRLCARNFLSGRALRKTAAKSSWPCPKYHGFISTVEQEINAQKEKPPQDSSSMQ